jgi:hypothetical protein
MATTTETRTGSCATHGTVQAERQLPPLTFPSIIAVDAVPREAEAIPLPRMRFTDRTGNSVTPERLPEADYVDD